jgi:hypothetical protein
MLFVTVTALYNMQTVAVSDSVHTLLPTRHFIIGNRVALYGSSDQAHLPPARYEWLARGIRTTIANRSFAQTSCK